MNTKKTCKREPFRLDNYIAERDKDPARQIHRLDINGKQSRLTRARMRRYGECYRGFVYALSKGMIDSEETNLLRLFKDRYAGLYTRQAEGFGHLQDALFMQVVNLEVEELEWDARGIVSRGDTDAWSVFDTHFFLVEGEEGIHFYRRTPQE